MNLLSDKSVEFAIRIVNLYKYLNKDKNEYVMSKQLLRSGTSIGANISESIYAISKEDFLFKYTIAMKEASETQFWLKILFETEYLLQKEYDSLMNDCLEISKLLASSIKTLKGQN